LLGGRLQIVLIAFFSVVAALTVGLNALVVSQVIRDYLETAQDNRVARDMKLAEAFYQLKQDEITAVGHRMVQDPRVIQSMPAAFEGQAEAIQVVTRKLAARSPCRPWAAPTSSSYSTPLAIS